MPPKADAKFEDPANEPQQTCRNCAFARWTLTPNPNAVIIDPTKPGRCEAMFSVDLKAAPASIDLDAVRAALAPRPLDANSPYGAGNCLQHRRKPPAVELSGRDVSGLRILADGGTLQPAKSEGWRHSRRTPAALYDKTGAKVPGIGDAFYSKAGAIGWRSWVTDQDVPTLLRAARASGLLVGKVSDLEKSVTDAA